MASTAVPLSTPPAIGQLVEHDGRIYETVREGQAFILIIPNTQNFVDPREKAKAADSRSKPQNVFYNPIQQFNRDLSVLAIKAFGEDFCEKRRIKYELQRPKIQSRKEQRRKRKQFKDERDSDGVTKLRKTDGGVGIPVEEAALNRGDDIPMDDEASQDVGAYLDAEIVSNGQSHASDPVAWQPNFRILDALSATGLRALRYAQEIPFATAITANDMDCKATNNIKINIEHNQLSSKITTNTGNAISLMYNAAFPPSDLAPRHANAKFEVIDLDPYGTAVPFIDAALQALSDEGLLCVTCTDSGVFASCGYSEKTFSSYGGIPIKGLHSHEGGLRLVLQSVAVSAAKYGLAVEPLLSLSIDFYVRLFIRVRRSPADVKFLASKTMLVYCCDAGCGAWTTQVLGRSIRQKSKDGADVNFKRSIAQAPSADRLCEHCGSKTHVAGPMWAGPIHNAAFVEKLIEDVQRADKAVYETKPRLEGMLDTALDELAVIPSAGNIWQAATRENGSVEVIPKTSPEVVDLHPFFFIPSALAKVLHCQSPPEAALKGALRHAGYISVRSHCKPGSIKTDAPWSAIWEIMREWVRQKSPIKEGSLKEGLAGWNILHKTRKAKADEFDKIADGEGDSESESKANGTERAEGQIQVIFDEVLGKDKLGKRLVRYQQNPRENWGPMTRANGNH